MNKSILYAASQQGALLNQTSENEAEVDMYISALSSPLSNEQIFKLNGIAKYLKTQLNLTQLSDYFDVIYLLSNETEEAYPLNFVQRLYDAEKKGAGTLVFSANDGVTPNNAYLDTNFNPVAANGNYQLNSASIMVYSKTNNTTSRPDMGVQIGTSITSLFPYNYGVGVNRINQNSTGNVNINNMPTDGFILLTRVAYNLYYIFRNLVNNSGSSTSSELANGNIYIFTRNQSGSPGSISDRKLAFAAIAKGVTVEEEEIINAAVQYYVNDINISVFSGASSVAGLYVGADERFSALVSVGLNNTEVNLGVSGRPLASNPTTPDGNSAYEQMELIPPKTNAHNYLFMHWGGNDIVKNYIGSTTTTESSLRFKAQYIAVIDDAISKGWSHDDIKLLTFFFPTSTRWPVLKDIILEIGVEKGVQVIDVATHLYNGGDYAAYIGDDNLHMTVEGHQEFANYVLSQL